MPLTWQEYLVDNQIGNLPLLLLHWDMAVHSG